MVFILFFLTLRIINYTLFRKHYCKYSLKFIGNVCMFDGLQFYGLTKDPETNEFMMIIQFASKGNLRSILLNNFNNMLWEHSLSIFCELLCLALLHNLECIHKDFYSRNILLFSEHILSFQALDYLEQKYNDNVIIRRIAIYYKS